MSQLGNLEEDFLACALDDRGESITLKHKTSQDLNTSTGDYTTVENTQAINAVVTRPLKKDIDLNPSKYQVTDRVFYFREEDLGSGMGVEIGDEITYNSTDYKIFEYHNRDGVYQVIAKKAQ